MRTYRFFAVLALAVVVGGCSSSTVGSGAESAPASTPTGPAPTHSGRPSAPVRTPASSPNPSSKSAAPSATTSAVPTKPLLTKSVVADSGTRYVIKVWAQTEDADCAAHAYGTPVLEFLKKHACSGLARRLVTTTVHGRAVGFAQSSIGFKAATDQAIYAAAGQFRALVTEDGTGNLNDLLREGYRLPSGPTSVPYPDAFLALSQDNNVSVVDAWYLQSTTPENDAALVHLAQDVYLKF